MCIRWSFTKWIKVIQMISGKTNKSSCNNNTKKLQWPKSQQLSSTSIFEHCM